MIKENELRIGNLFIDICGSYSAYGYEWQKHYFDKGLVDVFELIKPIPITPEILEKCGLYMSGDYFVFIDNEWFSVQLENTWCSLYCNKMYYAVDFKFLHQLQNLYFALTGEELNTEKIFEKKIC